MAWILSLSTERCAEFSFWLQVIPEVLILLRQVYQPPNPHLSHDWYYEVVRVGGLLAHCCDSLDVRPPHQSLTVFQSEWLRGSSHLTTRKC